ncbi:MAG TPA: TadE family protein [Dehalococcoidia bacterium]|nr:TadE family protein [Dehalococcoidia bacterium]
MVRGRAGGRGQAVVELALALPLLALLLFGIIDFGLGLSARIQVSNAVREGARLAAVKWQEADIEQQVRQRVMGLTDTVVNATLGTPVVEFPEGRTPGASVRVRLDCRYNFFVPGLAGIADLNCSSSTVMRLE